MSSTLSPSATIFQYDSQTDTYQQWTVVDVIARDDDFAAILARDNLRATAAAADLEAALENPNDGAWAPAMFTTDGNPVPHPRHTTEANPAEETVRLRFAPTTPSELTFKKIEGRGSRTEVNAFLEGATDDLVFHELGGVASWKAAFVARYNGAIVSALVLHHYHPSTNGEELAITRLANHTNAPHNTSTWMISRARKWAERVGYDRLATYAGVGGNAGVCYRAAGFDAEGDPVEVEGTNWTDDHHGDSDGDTTWLKQKYVYDLSPETYADKTVAWATETVCDDVTVPGRSCLTVDETATREVAVA